MRSSIRMKLFISITCFALVIVSLSWILNTKYLEKYYLEKKKESLMTYAEEIEDLYESNSSDMDEELERIENMINGEIIIFKADGEISYMHKRGGNGFGKMGRNIFLTQEGMESLYKGDTVLESYQHPRLNVKFLVLGKSLKNDRYLALQTSVASIKESVEIAKTFYIYIGIISMMIGTLLAFWYSKKFTKPILELNHVAGCMAKLDFSKKYKSQRDDEIGELGETMNYLSDKLDLTIGELNEANKKLMDDIEKERKIDTMRKEFISSVSHELKTPIALIKGYAEGLVDNVAEDEESKNFYCEVIMDETEKMGKLVKDLLDLSQIETGNTKLQIEGFNITALLEKVYNKYKPIFHDKHIDASLEKEEGIVKVKGDISKIEQVLVNFINNGIDHIDEKRKLKISIRDERQKAKIAISNTGKPIPEDEMERIWESFYKIDKSRTREYGGTGLGLSIVKGILNLHKSSFGVLNKDDGVEFWFELEKETKHD